MTIFDDGDLHVDLDRQEVTFGEELLNLSPVEYRVLAALVSDHRRVLSKQQLLEAAWEGGSTENPGRTKYDVVRLRRKLGWDGSGDDGSPIETVRGAGYRYRLRTSDREP